MIERYASAEEEGSLEPNPNGDWVLYSEVEAELARLRARPTEEEVAREIAGANTNFPWPTWLPAATRILALFPKVQP